MLGKLLKYEFFATGRIFLPLYAGFLIISIIVSFTIQTDSILLTIVSWFLLSLVRFAVFIITCVLLIMRFYRNLLKDEGYLMFTLPVKTSTLIASKLITACVWCIMSIKVGTLASIIVSRGFIDISWIVREMFANLPYFLNNVSILFIVLLVLTFLSIVALCIMHVYFSLAVGQLPPFGKHKILGAIVTYIGFATVLIVTATLIGMSEYFSATFFHTVDTFVVYDPIYPFATDLSRVWAPLNRFLALVIAFYTFFATVTFIGTSLILKRKLNLE